MSLGACLLALPMVQSSSPSTSYVQNFGYKDFKKNDLKLSVKLDHDIQ